MSSQSSTRAPGPTPEHFFRSINAFQLTRALKGALDLDVFTAIAEGNKTAKALAESRQASERGMRILCDCLAVTGFLTKAGGKYELTPDSAMFLDQRLPSYVGGAVEFLLSPTMLQAFDDVAAAVRKGGTVINDEGTMSHDDPVWVMVAFDWANVLEVGSENAEKFGVADRWRALPGSAFDVSFGAGYALVLLPNFFHHFDPRRRIYFRRVREDVRRGRIFAQRVDPTADGNRAGDSFI